MNLYRNFATQDEIDKEYNLEAAVPDMGPYVEFFLGESERARSSLPCTLDVPFGPTLDETMDIFPANEPGAPVLLFIHGGYWRILSSKEFSFVALGLVERGFTVVVSNYSLCPKVTIPEITRQSRAAVAAVYSVIEQYNGDPGRLYVSGHSAGGQQVAMLAQTDWAATYGLPSSLLKGVFPISGLFDLRPLRYSWLQPMLQLDTESVRSQSPQFHIASGGEPMLVTVGGNEPSELVRQSKEFCNAWQGAGNTARYWEQPGKNHFEAIQGFTEANSPICTELQKFVQECEST